MDPQIRIALIGLGLVLLAMYARSLLPAGFDILNDDGDF